MMPASARPRNALHAGFTLIEILVAISLLAILGVLGYRGLNSLQQTAIRLSDNSRRAEAIALASDRLLVDLAHALPIAVQQPGQSVQAAFRLTQDQQGHAFELILSRTARDDTAPRRIAYRMNHPEQTLELQQSPLRSDVTQAQAHPLLDGIQTVRMECLDRKGVWHSNWPMHHEQELPRLVRLTLTLSEGGVIERWIDVPAAE